MAVTIEGMCVMLGYRAMLNPIKLLGLYGCDLRLLVDIKYVEGVIGHCPTEKQIATLTGYKKGQLEKVSSDRLVKAGCLVYEGSMPRRFVVTPKGMGLVKDCLRRVNERADMLASLREL